jgi:hypothetical protein
MSILDSHRLDYEQTKADRRRIFRLHRRHRFRRLYGLKDYIN